MKFFYFKYSANSLNTYKDSKNFNKDFLKIIESTSPILGQQFAIPNEELSRLNTKFIKLNYSNNYMQPNIIILKKNTYIYKNIDKKINNFCTLFEGNLYIVYGSLVGDNICKNN